MSVELHTFFPFDPYKLTRSGSYIQGVYREWSSVAIGGDESDEEEDGDEGDQNEVGEPNEVGMLSVNPSAPSLLSGLQIPRVAQESRSDADGLGESFGGMSISPGHPRSVVMAS